MKINIYGSKDSAVLFYLRHKNIQVNKFIDGLLTSESIFNFNFVDHSELYEIKPVLQAEADLKKCYTVVATSEGAYWTVKRVLENMGLKEFENFEYFSTFQKKKIAVVYGNCNAFGVRDLLLTNKAFNDDYGVYPVKAICDFDNGNVSLREQLNDQVLDKCDLFLYQDVLDTNRFGRQFASAPILNKLNSACRKICLPNFVKFPIFLFPQTTPDVEHRYYNGVQSPFGARDCYLDCFHGVRSEDSLCRMITKEDIIDHQLIWDLFDEFVEKIKRSERTWDISVLDFILSNFRCSQLFYDLYHPSPLLLSFVEKEILKLIDTSGKYSNSVSSTVGGSYVLLDTTELPVYESVRKTLGIQYRTDVLCKTMQRNNSIVGQWAGHLFCTRTVREYVADYLSWNYGPGNGSV